MFFDNAFLAVINMSITASYTAAAVIIARILMKKAPKAFSYALWSVVLFRLICPVSFSSAFSIFRIFQPLQMKSSKMQYVPQDIGMMKNPTVDMGVTSISTALNSSLPAAKPLMSANPMQILISLGTIIWLTGVAIILLYSMLSYMRLNKRIRFATLVSDNIYETDMIKSPFVWGFIKPKIYLPVYLSENEREYIIFHENIHIRRFDYLVKPIAFLALTVHWFNPLMWLCFSLMTKDMEMSCDEQVIKSAVDGNVVFSYSSSLLALAVNRKMPRPSPLAFGESNVKSRIKNILNYRKPAFWVVAVSFIAVITLVVMLISNPDAKGLSIYEHPVYNVDSLMKNKTQYIGNHTKVGSLITGMPLQEGITHGTLELSTEKPPYGVTYYYNLSDDSIAIDEAQFLKNSVILFALIDNADVVTHMGFWNNKLLSSTPFKYTYTRADAEKIVGGDVRRFGRSRESLIELMDVIDNIKDDSRGKVTVKAEVTLRNLVEEEYQSVGTSEIENPTMDDFKKLTVALNVQGTNERKISFPEIRDIRTLLTDKVVWFSNSMAQDNQSEDYAQYRNAYVLYTRNITAEELRNKLKSLNIEVSYRNETGEMVKSVFNLGEAMVIN